MSSGDPASIQASSHGARVLGICWMLYGVLCIVNAVWLATFTPTATVMFGALLNRVADPFTLMNAFHFIYTLAIVVSALRGIMGILAGFTLAARASSARM